jgi:4-hydroxythreonine-4-phosphate dehydrogenase
MASKFKIVITTGDPDGIGWEVTAKALNDLSPIANVQYVVYRSTYKSKAKQVRIQNEFKHFTVRSLHEAEQIPFSPKTLIVVNSSLSPALWVEEAAVACKRQAFDALVTAPLSKVTIAQAGLKDIGHTEILARVCNTRKLFMGFVGNRFSVVLATGHSPLNLALRKFDAELLTEAIHAAYRMRTLLPPQQQKRPLAVVGVNPHAGEEGLIGTEEKWMIKTLKKCRPQIDVEGPLVPDAAFLPQNQNRYSVFVCPYHDQGLIPFKMVHGFKGGVHITLGLPFVRTSVDHGTAKDIFGKNRAQFGSMKDALKLAVRLCKESHL